METVKILYVRNLMIETSEDTLRQTFSQFNPGCVERVKKIRDYAFVHFASRDDAVVAMDNLNGTEIEGSRIEVTLAKPVDKEQYTRYQKASKGTAAATPTDNTQQSYVYQCDPYTLAYYGYPYSTLIGPNRDYFIKGWTPHFFLFTLSNQIEQWKKCDLICIYTVEVKSMHTPCRICKIILLPK